jgi:hypothetical protein
MNLVLTDHAVWKAVQLGVVPDDESGSADVALRKYIDLAAPISHPKGQFRYDDWVFRIDAGRLVDVNVILCSACDDSGEVVMYEPCYGCDCRGTRIDSCGYRETIMVPCNVCGLEN